MDREAFERARSAYGTGAYDDATLEFLFPQLKESEEERNERMRKRVIESLVCYRGKVYDEGDKVVASMVDEEIIWMRKQKEQKPISSCDIVPYIDDKIAALQDMWREEKVAFDWDDMHEMIEDVARHFYQKEQKPVVTHGETYHVDTLGTQQVIAGKMPQKPAEWSEEDEKQIAQIERIVKNAGCAKMLQDKIHNWFKSLRPSWRPSEEQMEALERCVEYLEESDNEDADILAGLYEQLKKLKGQEEPEYYQHFDPDC